MVAYVDRRDLLLGNQQLQRDAVRQVDRHRMHPRQPAAQGMQPQRRVMRIGLQQRQCFGVLAL